ncbi:alternate F1F0 ATPase, F1 subunit alpha [Aliifodinibius sp. S!AR15-10]|uniref:alternate F1F0 ATPase, F1 subunit alpha n=1 Tax=Aliifodinibius sp. S!AR15-10 TaxID=2950437 RepID=UPI00285D7BD7|nr:alternate F1F0 ATPase, F1 subunit alpha [Aliifodinibius sp. S!AR15-10]MDR8393262.1 alternate F1F0 ATPase, F1 subunit alpha [Aliifodinibius sp. S!AR15-10]
MQDPNYSNIIQSAFAFIKNQVMQKPDGLQIYETGTVLSIGEGIALVDGLPDVKSDELLKFPHGVMGMAYNLDEKQVGVILLDEEERIEAGDEVHRTGRVLDLPVGDLLLGRVIDPLGRPLDGEGVVYSQTRYAVERPAPPIMHRDKVATPLQTGIKTIDALIPIGRGQRELILGDRQTGKTAIAIDTIINQNDKDVICIYCAVGKQNAAIAKVIADLKKHDAMSYSIVVSAGADAPAGIQFVAPYAATSIGEYFMERGRDVLVVYDDLTWHARAYRQMALLLRRPPGREAYPGDIFYIHARLLERATLLKEEYGSGSLTAFPIIETQSQNISAFIPTNLISITDGQIYLSPQLFQRDILPAIDIGLSVSRVGGAAQLPYYRFVSKNLKLSYTQFQELEIFSRFSARMDEASRKIIERGRRVREVMKQPQYDPMSVIEQVAELMAVNEGFLDELELSAITEAKKAIRTAVKEKLEVIAVKIESGEHLLEEERVRLMQVVRDAVDAVKGKQKQEADYAAD